MTTTKLNKKTIEGQSPYQKVLGAFVAVFIVSFIVFIPGLQNNFLYTWDDGGWIVYNDHIRTISIEMLRWAFFESYAGNWVPLTWISFSMDYALWGTNPVGYHLTNHVIHSLNTGLFFLISFELVKKCTIARLSDDSEPGLITTNISICCALLAALFFGIHPLRVESVAWATERKDVLSLFFGLPALLFYLKYTQFQSTILGGRVHNLSFATSRYYWLSVAFFSLSLMSKSMLVTLPLVLLTLDWFPLKRLNLSSFITIFLEKVVFILLSGLVLLITYYAQSTTFIPVEVSSLSSRLLIGFKSIMSYLLNTVYPRNLSPFYLHPGNIKELSYEYSLPVLFFVIVTACCTLYLKRYPVFMATWLIYLITLIPVLGFAPIGLVEMADRYTYVPGLALSLLVALCIITLFTRYSHSRPAVIVISAVTLLTLLINSYLTIRQISYWKDDVSLWSRPIAIAPHFSGRVYYQRGRSYSISNSRVSL